MALPKSKPTQESLEGRRAFDLGMERLKKTSMFSLFHLEEITKITGFNVRRFAYWVTRHSKKITQELAAALKRNFGSYGGLVLGRHVV
jgi:hypothetical protein